MHKPKRITTFLGVFALAILGCREEALRTAPGESGEYPAGLSPKQAAMVLAKVGDRSITLGDYAAALDSMDGFDRLRYRAVERRRELLDEMINVELLAIEAERRGLDKDPETQEALFQVLRDAVLADARKRARSPADIKDDEARAYYEAHKSDFVEPERRRISHLVTSDRKTAQELLAKAKTMTDPQAWGRLVLEHSDQYKSAKHPGPVETAGDLGFVAASTNQWEAKSQVPESVRAAAFDIARAGDVLDRVVEDDNGKFHLVWLVTVNNAHTRSFEESERTIRIIIADRESSTVEQRLEQDLRRRHPVTIDEAALAEAKVEERRFHAPSSSSPPSPTPPAGAAAGQAPNDQDEDDDHGR